MVDFEWYRSFIYIYKYKSVTEAAKARIMTQPGMSQHLASLEAEVGELLFHRTTRKMVPTERGKELYTQLAPLIESLEETSLSLQTATVPTNSIIRIGSAIEYYDEYILPELTKLKSCTISHFGTADQLIELLKEDKVEIVITSKKFQEPGIEYVELCDEEFVIVGPATLNPPLGIDLESKEKWLLSQKWISYGLELPIIRRLWREHFKKRPIIKTHHIIPNLHLILKSIEMGLGISLIPTYIWSNSKNTNKAKVLFEELKVTNKLWIAYKTKNKNLPQIRFMKETWLQS
jgi:DNA-binding transcriptional LysR family regulator